jgi:plasmid replication initiation protein
MDNKKIMAIKFNDNKLVVKSNQIIEAKYKLNLIEQRIILFLVSLINKDDEVFKLWRIKISELAEFLGINPKNSYRDLKNTTFAMVKKGLRLKSQDRELQLNWLASADYFNKEGFVELEISEKLKPFLLQLKKNFTKYNLKDIISLKSAYSIRIYELLKQYEKIKERYFELEDLKKKLGVNNKYKLYKDFKRRIILKAQEELSKKTDISFNFKEKKHARKVIGITFIIKINENYNSNKTVIKNDYNAELFKKLKKYFKQSDKQTEWILKNIKEDDLKLALEVLEKRYKKSKIENLGAYTWGYFEKGQYKSDIEKSKFDIEQKEKEEKKKKEQAIKALEEKLKQDYEIYLNDCIKDFENKFSKEKKEELKKEAEKQTDIKYSNNRFKNSFIKWEYRIIIQQEIEKQNLIISFEDWRKKKIKKYKKF